MDVTVLKETQNAEQLVCRAGRGDYMSEWNGDKSFTEVMSDVAYNDTHLEQAKANNYYPDLTDETEAKMTAFIQKRLSQGHYGIAEHPSITFSVTGVSRVTMAQITRHRHMSFDIQSQRYVDFSETDAVVPESLLDADHFSRETGLTELDEDKLSHWRNAYKAMTSEQLDFYEDMVNAGVPKEDARFVLPLGTPVNMTFTGNARTFMHVFNLRQKASSQWEIRKLSDMLAEELKEWMPITFNWYENNKPHKIGP